MNASQQVEDTRHGGLSLAERLARTHAGPGFPRLVRQALSAENYGKPDGWCVSEIIRMPSRRGTPIIDALMGVTGRGAPINPAHRLQLAVPIRVFGTEPLEICSIAPTMDDEPTYFDEEAGSGGHHHPSQWGERTVVAKLEGTVNIQLGGDTCASSAVWLLRQYGWKTRRGGKDKRRFIQTNLREHPQAPNRFALIDTWRVVEVAFERMYPRLAPPKDFVPGVQMLPGPATPAVPGGPDLAAELAQLRAELDRLRKGTKKDGPEARA